MRYLAGTCGHVVAPGRHKPLAFQSPALRGHRGVVLVMYKMLGSKISPNLNWTKPNAAFGVQVQVEFVEPTGTFGFSIRGSLGFVHLAHTWMGAVRPENPNILH